MTCRFKIIIVLIIFSFLLFIPLGFAEDMQENPVSLNNTSAACEIYFDSNADSDGNGSISSPFQYLSEERVKENAVHHFADGNYDFVSFESKNNVTFIGSDALKTNIMCIYPVNYEGTFVLKNITVSNAQFSINGVFNASNTVFKSSSAKTVRYDNSYGGAIYALKAGYDVYIDNCTFFNNSAQYGGAIYMNGGILDIINSRFINNTAFNYGGAVACESNSRVRIANTSFSKSVSKNDAGGAVYIRSGSINAVNVNITGSNATFGGAMTLLSCDSNLNGLYLFNNTARYDGGAIYQFAGNLKINNSQFIKNNANLGAGFYATQCGNLSVENTLFDENKANLYAGTFYSIKNKQISVKNLTFDRDDSLTSDSVSTFISNGNYTLYTYNPEFNGTLPSRFMLDNLTVKDQQDGGNCWAFATIASLESCIRKASGENLILSEENMKNLMATYSNYGWSMDTNNGGYDDMGVGYLASWLGPVLACDDAYDGQSTLSPVLNSITHIQNIVYVKRDNFTDNDGIKKAVMDYGAVFTSIYMTARYDSTNKCYAQYYKDSTSSNHAVCIVGWDDDFKVSGAPASGAWICKNSWNENWGNNGYFYVSYWDTSCAKVGSPDASFTFLFNDTMKFDKNYQYDIPGRTDFFFNTSHSVWYKNRFTASDNEYLAAVSTYFNENTDWTLSVIVGNALKTVQNGFSTPGYKTIELKDLVRLSKGDVFEIIFNITVSGDAGVPISEAVSLVNEFYSNDVSYVSWDGVNWYDFYTLAGTYPNHNYASQTACIKAFTIFKELNTTLTLDSISDGFGIFNFTAHVLNQYGKIVHGGTVIFNINGISCPVNVDEGVAKLTYDLPIGLNNISAQYNSVGFKQSVKSTSVTVSKSRVNIDWNSSLSLDTAHIKITLSKPLSETLTLTVGGKKYTLKSKDGVAETDVENLALGRSDVKIHLENDIYISEDINSYITVTPFETVLSANDLVTVFSAGDTVKVKLADKNSNAVKNQKLSYTLNGKTYSSSTDSNGEIAVSADLPVGEYELKIVFDGSKMYLKSEKSVKITVKTSLTLPHSDTYTYNSTYRADFTDKKGKAFSGDVRFIIDSVKYDVKASDGVQLLLTPGSHSISAVNLLTGEVKNQTVSVLERICENNDMDTYYGFEYKVKVLDDFGNPEKGAVISVDAGGIKTSLVTDSDGYASFTPSLNPGKYVIAASYKGFSVKNNVNVKTTVTLPAASRYTYNSTYGAEFVAASDVKYIVNGVAYNVGAGEGVTLLLAPGTYTVSAVNLASGEVKNHTVTVVSRISENRDADVYYGFEYKLKVHDDYGNPLSGANVTFTADGKTCTAVSDASGYASFRPSLNPGKHVITASYKGFTVKNNVNVKTTVTLPAASRYTYNSTYGAEFVAASDVKYIVNGVAYNVKSGEGVTLLLAPGTYTVSVVNLASGEVKNHTVTVVSRISENRDIETYYGSSDIYKVKVLDDYGNPLSGANVTFTADGKTYTAVSDSSAYASFKNSLGIGNHEVTASYRGFTVKNTVSVKTSLELPSKTVYTYNSSYCASFRGASYVSYTVDGVKYTVKAGESIQILLAPGTYTVSAANLETGEVKNQSITVLARISENSDLDTYCGFEYKVKVLDDYGNPLSGANVTFTADGKTYTAVSDASGYASFRPSLNPGSYVITASFKGFEVSNTVSVKTTVELPKITVYTYNSTYKAGFIGASNVRYTIGGVKYTVKAGEAIPVLLKAGNYTVSVTNLLSGEVKTQNIRVVERISQNKDMSMYYGANKYYKVKVLDDNGNPVKNLPVTFKINSKSYVRITDKNGYASLKISLKAKKYTITASYKGFTVKNKITVKSTLVTKNMAVKKGKTLKFSVKLLNKNGKIIKNKKVTVKFKGKTYKIKTNSKGIAVLKLKIKYRPGKYTIKTSYGKASVSNKITVKK